MNIDNDWIINLQVSHTTEIPRGFGKEDDDDDIVADVNEVPSPSFPFKSVVNVNVPRLPRNMDMLNNDNDDDEEERLFGAVSDDDGDEKDVNNEEEDYYDEDAGTLNNVVLQNNIALQVLINREMDDSDKIMKLFSCGDDGIFYCYAKGRVFDTPLRNECLLISVYVHYLSVTQSNNFKRIMN